MKKRYTGRCNDFFKVTGYYDIHHHNLKIRNQISMTRLWRYLFSHATLLTLGGATILIAAIWLTQSLRFIDYVMTRGLTIPLFLKLASFLLPSLVSTILPIAFFIAVLFLLSKFYGDNELIVMRSLGFSNLRILTPILCVAVCVIGVLYITNFFLYPGAAKQFRELREDIRTNISSRWIQPGVFQDISGVTFYTKKKTRAGEMQGIFVHDARNPQKVSTMTAELGKIIETSNGLRLVLVKGTRQSLDATTKKPNLITFDNYSLDVKNPHVIRSDAKRPSELSLAELFTVSADQNEDQRLQNRTYSEAHERIILPLVVLPLTLLAGLAFLLGDYNRRGKSMRVMIAVLGALVIEIGLFSLVNMFEKNLILIPITYGLLLGITLILLIKLVKLPPQKKQPYTLTATA